MGNLELSDSHYTLNLSYHDIRKNRSVNSFAHFDFSLRYEIKSEKNLVVQFTKT